MMRHTFTLLRNMLLTMFLFSASDIAFAQTYCTPVYTSGCFSLPNYFNIHDVILSGANGTSINQSATGCSMSGGGYSDYTASVAAVDLQQGATYAISITNGTASYQQYGNAVVWIDFGNDGSFDQVDSVGMGTGTSANFFIPIIIPATGTIGSHRMRLRTAYFNPVNGPCASNNNGETHDYTVNVTSSTTTTCAAPTGLTTMATTSTSCGVSWTAPATPPANGYEYYFSTSSVNPTAATTPSGSTPATFKNITGLTPATQYYVWVRSVCSTTDKSPWTNSGTFTTNAAITCATPIGLMFSTVTSTTAALSWSAPASAPTDGYEYYYAVSGGPAPVAATVPSGNVAAGITTVSLSGLTPATQYDIWVRSACSPTSKSNWSLPATFVTNGVCDAPTGVNVSNVTATSAIISWVAPGMAPANGYEYYHSLSATAPTLATTASGAVSAGVTTVSVSGLSASTQYYVWVRSICNAVDKSDWSASANFTTSTPVCAGPTGLSASNITATSATISWAAAVPVPANGYEYYYNSTGTPPVAATVASGATGAGITTASLSGLNAATQYHVWVRSVCSATDKSSWSGHGGFTTQNPNGIESVSQDAGLKLFPNPAKDVLNIAYTGSSRMERITVFNMQGDVVFDRVPGSANLHQLNLLGFASGMYTLRVKMTESVVVQRFDVLR